MAANNRQDHINANTPAGVYCAVPPNEFVQYFVRLRGSLNGRLTSSRHSHEGADVTADNNANDLSSIQL